MDHTSVDLYTATHDLINCTAIGSYAGYAAIGYNETGSNKLYISNDASTNLITGDFSLSLGQTSGTVTILNDADIDGTLDSLSDVESRFINSTNISTNS